MRCTTSLVPHQMPIIRPLVSETLDYECELLIVIGKKAKHLTMQNAYSCIAGYSCFNDGSIRQFQRRTAQWDMGKNFDMTGGFGPWMVSADELPQGAIGLKIETRLNGQVLQSDNTANMIFPVAETLVDLTPGDDADAGRRDRHRHAVGRRSCAQAAAVDEARRCLRDRHRRRRHSVQSDRGRKEGLMRRLALRACGRSDCGGNSGAGADASETERPSRARARSAPVRPDQRISNPGRNVRRVRRMRIGVGHGIGFLPLYLANDLKLFDKHAKAAGLTGADRDPALQFVGAAASGAEQGRTRRRRLWPVGVSAGARNAEADGGDFRRHHLAAGAAHLASRTSRRSSDIKPGQRIAVPLSSAPQMRYLRMQAEQWFTLGLWTRLQQQVVVMPHQDALDALTDGQGRDRGLFLLAAFHADGAEGSEGARRSCRRSRCSAARARSS